MSNVTRLTGGSASSIASTAEASWPPDRKEPLVSPLIARFRADGAASAAAIRPTYPSSPGRVAPTPTASESPRARYVPPDGGDVTGIGVGRFEAPTVTSAPDGAWLSAGGAHPSSASSTTAPATRRTRDAGTRPLLRQPVGVLARRGVVAELGAVELLVEVRVSEILLALAGDVVQLVVRVGVGDAGAR